MQNAGLFDVAYATASAPKHRYECHCQSKGVVPTLGSVLRRQPVPAVKRFVRLTLCIHCPAHAFVCRCWCGTWRMLTAAHCWTARTQTLPSQALGRMGGGRPAAWAHSCGSRCILLPCALEGGRPARDACSGLLISRRLHVQVSLPRHVGVEVEAQCEHMSGYAFMFLHTPSGPTQANSCGCRTARPCLRLGTFRALLHGPHARRKPR